VDKPLYNRLNSTRMGRRHLSLAGASGFALTFPPPRRLPEAARKLDVVEGLLRLRGEPAWVLLPYAVEVG